MPRSNLRRPRFSYPVLVDLSTAARLVIRCAADALVGACVRAPATTIIPNKQCSPTSPVSSASTTALRDRDTSRNPVRREIRSRHVGFESPELKLHSSLTITLGEGARVPLHS